MQYAKNSGLLDKNPCEGIEPLAEKDNKRGAFTKAQVKTLIEVEWDNPLMKLAAILAAFTGMRTGEIRALRPCDLHDGYIHISKSWSNTEGLKSTKSGEERDAVLPEWLEKELRKYLPSNERYIFSVNGRLPVSEKLLATSLYGAMEKAGIDRAKDNLSFHSFRHFFNSQLVANGIKGELIRETIGHSNASMTHHYAHITAEDMELIREVQDSLFKVD